MKILVFSIDPRVSTQRSIVGAHLFYALGVGLYLVMDLTFTVKIGPTLEVWILKLGGEFL